MPRTRIPADAELFRLPAGLPAPVDDGAARHLPGAPVPHLRLRSTASGSVDVGALARRLSVFFVYPATVAPPAVIPGEWSEVPGARGCTVENVGFRAAYPGFRALDCRLVGVSGQGQPDGSVGLAEQVDLARRLHLPFDLLNDSAFELATALDLPTFEARLRHPTVTFEGRRATFPLQGRRLYRRLTFVADRGAIEKVFYPVFPPDRHAEEVLAYLRARPPPRRERRATVRASRAAR